MERAGVVTASAQRGKGQSDGSAGEIKDLDMLWRN